VANREWKWTRKRIEAAGLLAEDELSDEKVAATIGVSRSTIALWKLNPFFTKRVQGLVVAWERKVMSSGIANKARRVNVLNHLHGLQMEIVEKRSLAATLAAAAGLPTAPGETTGLVVRQRRLLRGANREALVAEKAEFDHAISREIRATLDHAAKETGQLVERHDVSGGQGRSITTSIELLDDIAARVREARERNAAESTIAPQADA
jgi:hypothetical protein